MASIKRAGWLSLVIGILLVVGGVIFIANPIESIITLVNMIGIFLIMIGVLRIVRYFTNDMFKTGLFLVGGAIDIVLGIVIITNQPISVVTFTTFIGFWQLFSGISEIILSIDLKRFEMPRWWLGIIAGILGLILGFLLIKDSLFSSIYISLIVGIYMIAFGTTFISTFFGLRRLIKRKRF